METEVIESKKRPQDKIEGNTGPNGEFIGPQPVKKKKGINSILL
jgi:hypothetical protein